MNKRIIKKLNKTLDMLILLEAIKAIKGYPDDTAKQILTKGGLTKKAIAKVLSMRKKV